jgi:anaerobic C4-dicarboxylate transporter
MAKKKESDKKKAMDKKKVSKKKSVDKKKVSKKKKNVNSGKGNSFVTWLFLSILITIVLSLAISYLVVSLIQADSDYNLDDGKIVVQVIPSANSGKILVEVIDGDNVEKEVIDGNAN